MPSNISSKHLTTSELTQRLTCKDEVLEEPMKSCDFKGKTRSGHEDDL